MIEVRCCCNAGQLLGWLDVNPPRHWTGITLLLDEDINKPIHLNIGLVQLRPGQRSYPAVKSDHIPMARLRRIRCFVEYKEMPLKIGQRVRARCNIYKPAAEDRPELLYASKGDELIVRSLSATPVYECYVSHANGLIDSSFGVLPGEIEEVTNDPANSGD